jgi:signal transduction histidine kinase
MKSQAAELGSELRLSPKPVLLLLVALSIGLTLALESLLNDAQIQGFLWLDIALFVFCALIWWLDGFRTNVARYLTLLLIEAIVFYGYVGLGMGAFAALLPLLPALAIAMTSVPCALAVAASETLLVIALQRFALVPYSSAGDAALVILSIWASLALLGRLLQHLTQVDRWAQDYLKLAHDLIHEQRDRRAELAETMSDLVDANRQLTQMNVLAHGLRHAAEEARLAKERFVANVSHELRTPLNMITGFSRMILEMPQTYGDLIPPALLADLSVVHRNAEHLSSLIDDVLDLSQIDARHMAITKEQVHLSDLVEAAVVATRPLFRSKRLYVRVDIEEDLPPVFCDRTRILEVLLNLLSNAGRFTEQGGVTVRVWQEQGDLVVSVADTGPGIAKNDEHTRCLCLSNSSMTRFVGVTAAQA